MFEIYKHIKTLFFAILPQGNFNRVLYNFSRTKAALLLKKLNILPQLSDMTILP